MGIRARFYFPEQIKNWFCDDWITKVYYPNYFYPINHWIINRGGEPRYEISGSIQEDDPVKKRCQELIIEGKKKINKYL